MFELKRVEKDEENSFTVGTPDGFIKIVGTSDFVVRMVKDICENSQEFQKELRKNLMGETKESVAAKMREAGFPEQIVRDFEEGLIWHEFLDD